ncbi:MAG: RNA polymerase sporulation sigma factor SigF [Clostridium sp.]|nr:RNA polymerase sporulation sigma factor SigF [Clostridium sp.]MDY3828120.1 RNA polymerase sporulation sigma factor SigF [Clostridium sp.]
MEKKGDNFQNNSKLLENAKNGDTEATKLIIEANLPLVTSLSKKFLNRGYEYDEIFQVGCIGLIKAVNNFDSSFQVKFSTYAVPMIIGEIRRFIRDDGIMRISRSIKTNIITIHFAKEELEAKLHREPTIEEISNYCNIDKEEVILATEAALNVNYLYDTVHQDDGAAVLLIDKIGEKNIQNDNILDKLALKEAISQLEDRERKIIILRYFKDKTQKEVAKMLGISQVQVSRIEKRVLSIMKEKLKEI